MSDTRKLFPRNATARSHKWISGNPVTTRPESGVDNSYPGLEFDQRNLDKRFFPGLEFEFHSDAVLRSVNGNADPRLASEIIDEELISGLVLLSVNGRFGGELGINQDRTVAFSKRGALDDWSQIHDLEPGPLAIAIVPFNEVVPRDESISSFEDYLKSTKQDPEVARDGEGQLLHIFAHGFRARYLNEDGVIDPAEYQPGEITRSLCSPWQYDFALCGCFYWASNKPDMVKRDDESPQFSNFQRVRSTSESAVEPITDYQRWEGELSNNISEHGMISDWESLPAVFNGIESNGMELARKIELPKDDILGKNAVIAALMDLATVEHGLMVEYLYAYYSLDSQAFGEESDAQAKVDSAAETVLSIAIDEMRHFRWVNEMLLSLGSPPELGRFVNLPDIDNDGRSLEHVFSLQPLSPDRLQWFIDVEAPSDKIDVVSGDESIDGMYTRLLLSVSQGSEFTDTEKQKLLLNLKLIIDEGYDHYLRFLRVQDLLEGLDPTAYLRLQPAPTPLPISAPAHVFEKLVDISYAAVIDLLTRLFVPVHVGRIDALVVGARELMYNLDEAARVAVANGGSPHFHLPIESGLGVAAEGMDLAEAKQQSLSQFIEKQIIPNFEKLVSDGLDDMNEGKQLAQSLLSRLRSAKSLIEEIE